MNVLFVTRKWPPAIGGMETYSHSLVRELQKLVNLDTMKLPGSRNGSTPNLFKLFIFVIRCAAKILMSKSYDIIHIGDMVLWPLAYLSSYFCKAEKVLITAYGLDILYGERRGFLPLIYKLYLKLGVRLIGKKVKILAISNPTAKLCVGYGFLNVNVVKLGVELKYYNETDNAVSDDQFILFVGRLVKRKGCAWFISNVLPELAGNIKLIVVGRGVDFDELKAIYNKDRVVYLGQVSSDELTALRRKALVVIMPNISGGGIDFEGFGLTALEAAADGGVLLASSIDGIVDAVVDGVTGFLLQPEAACAWVESINDILNWSYNRRVKFLENSLKCVSDNFSWTTVAQNTATHYF